MSNLPSDDSEDSDYDPSNPKTHSDDDKEEEEESSSADESDFTASSEGSGPSNPNPNKQYDYTGLPSDDSEDDDYDPDCPDPDKDSQKEESNSDESDFTSDSDEFCSEIVKASVGDEVSALPNDKPFDHHGEQRSIMEPELGQGSPLPNPGKRQREHLDYKKLYDVRCIHIFVGSFLYMSWRYIGSFLSFWWFGLGLGSSTLILFVTLSRKK